MSKKLSFQEAIQAVKLQLDIVDVVGRTVQLKRMGRNFKGLCPFHQEKTPSFYVHPDKQLFKCFGCGEGGDALSFLMKVEHKPFAEIITEQADEMGIEIASEFRQAGAKDERDVLIELHRQAHQFFEHHRPLTPDIEAYLDSREISAEWRRHFGLGYAPAGWENLLNHLRLQLPVATSQPNLLEKSGLVVHRSEGQGFYDRFRHRLMIPIHDDRGRVVAFGGRALSDADPPKYLNSSETPIYNKSRTLYGFHLAKESMRTSKSAIVMEGYFDVIRAHMAGLAQTVGVCGTAFTDQHLKLLQRQGIETVYLCFDSDKAGQAAALRAIEMIENQILESGLAVHVVTLPGEKDPDDFIKHAGKDAFEAQLQTAPDFLSFKFQQALDTIENPHSPAGRIQAVQRLAPMLLQIRQHVIRLEYVKKLAEELRLPDETILLEIKRLEKLNPTYQNKKSFSFEAISNSQGRYKGRQGRYVPSVKPEDTSPFRHKLAQKLSVEDKEHLILSYLLVNDTSYTTVMNAIQNWTYASPLAQEFMAALDAIDGEWNRIEELVQRLTVQFHADENTGMLQFLADRVVTSDQIQERLRLEQKDLNSELDEDKLRREIADVIDTIESTQSKTALHSIQADVKSFEANADDKSALEYQERLKEQLAARRASKLSSPSSQSQSTFNNIQALKQQEQGV